MREKNFFGVCDQKRHRTFCLSQLSDQCLWYSLPGKFKTLNLLLYNFQILDTVNVLKFQLLLSFCSQIQCWLLRLVFAQYLSE